MNAKMHVDNHHIEHWPKGRSGDPELEAKLIAVFKECFLLWCGRHKKHGRNNISKFGEFGCLVRASDKLEWLTTLLFHGQGGEAEDETVGDSWMDLVNYSAMALLCRRGLWPEGEDSHGE
jgi:hypothetical protein